jgi:dihydroorotate dehydrogenase
VYRSVARPLLFRLDAERAHHLTLSGAALAGRVPGLSGAVAHALAPARGPLTQTLWGRRFTSPIGLGAGLDKNAQAVALFTALGFGFVEVGTVTPRPQPGNPQPRLFRLPPDGALINRMGFNNGGAEAVAAALRGVRHAPVWVNIGKNKDTPNEQAASDYLSCVRTLAPVADAFVINVSSPNTPGLRMLQAAGEVAALARAVVAEVQAIRSVPVLVKLSPDMDPDDYAASVTALHAAGVSGLIVSNTTLGRAGLEHAHRGQAGGLSGRPLTQRSTALVAQAHRLTGGQLPIVGVGGVFSAQDAYDKILAGASLVEVYTGFVYEGPLQPWRLNQGLLERLRVDGFGHVSEAVGAGL